MMKIYDETEVIKTMQWIINKKQDLLFFIGSILASYTLLSIYYGLSYFVDFSIVVCSAVVYFIWTIFFDATHIFATYTRTYFDKDFRQKNKKLIYGGLLLLLIGPLYMLLFSLIGSQEQYRAAFLVFNRFGILYAYYHLIRQHWGFMMIYNRKNGGCTPFQMKLEGLLLWSGTIFPLVYHHIYHYIPFGIAEKMADGIIYTDWLFICKTLLGISAVLFLIKAVISQTSISKIVSKLAYIFSISTLVLYSVVHIGVDKCLYGALYLSGATFVVSLLLYIGYLLYPLNKSNIAVPKLMLLSLVIITNNFILSLDMPYIAAYACITVFHNIQYHAIVRFHNKNKYLEDEVRFGFASRFTRNLILFAVIALAFNLIFTLPKTVIDYVTLEEILVYFIASFFWGIGFHHYVFDAIIWRPSRDKEVKDNLQIRHT